MGRFFPNSTLMPNVIRTYLVGRRNQTVSCDIALPESETSVSRKHLELTLTASGKCYIVHVHPQNTTKVQASDGKWTAISQDYVELNAPLMLGNYRTSARQLLAMLHTPPAESRREEASPPVGAQVEWDPERGTFMPR
jgi:hypothetical protein